MYMYMHQYINVLIGVIQSEKKPPTIKNKINYIRFPQISVVQKTKTQKSSTHLHWTYVLYDTNDNYGIMEDG